VRKTPEAFCDPASVASLLAGALVRDPAEPSRRLFALVRVVKALEGDRTEEGGASWKLIKDRLPELVEGFTDPDDDLCACLSSIMKRIQPTAPTVERMLELYDRVPAPSRQSFVAALGSCKDEAWTERAERVVLAIARDPDHNNAFYAADVLGWKARLPETVGVLVSLVKEGRPIVEDHALTALFGLLRRPLGSLAATALGELCVSAPLKVRLKIAADVHDRCDPEVARPLLARCAADLSPAVKAAAEASLAKIAPKPARKKKRP
jgi:hypothetical protein